MRQARCPLLGALLLACVGRTPVPDEPLDAPRSDAALDADALPPLPDVQDPDAAPTPALRLRRTLGIPDEARRVLLFGQNAHLDLDWLRTQEDYYAGFVEQIYARALDALAADPAYRYATAEMGFLRMFYERNPARREELLRALREGRFQVVGGGVSVPDVLLPSTENLLRDFHQGAAWLRGIDAPRTRAAYLPDPFGLGATTPDLLRAAGFDAVAFWRVDGSSDTPEFNATIADFGSMRTTPGTNAALLADARAVDFLWEGPGGARVFAHWLSHSYLFGDYLDYEVINFRQYGAPVGNRLRSDEAVMPNVQTALDLLLPVSPTDYAFLPIGGDFVYPKPALASIAAHWNRTRFASTGVWVRAGTFAEYASLAQTQPERLPVRRLDMVPYWMGFFASRPALKDLARSGAAAADQAHKARALLSALGLSVEGLPPLDEAEWTLAASNHHDWVTGTSVDPVHTGEQLPRTSAALAQCNAALSAAVARLADALPAAPSGSLSAVVFNSESSPRDGLALLPLAAPAPDTVRSVRAQTLAGAPVPAQLTADRRGVALAVSAVPSLGYLGLRVTLSADAEASPPAGSLACLDGAGAALSCEAPEASVMQWTAGALSARFDLARGGPLTSLTLEGAELLEGPTLELGVFDDRGGLYTFGHEGGGALARRSLPGASALFRSARVLERGPARTVVRLEFTAEGLPYAVEYTLTARPWIDAVVTARAAPGTALLASFSTALRAPDALMAVPAGALRRAPGARFAPTFYPFEQWFAYEDADGQRGVTLSAPANPAVSFDAQGHVALVLHRNAPTEDHGPSGLGGSTNDPAALRLRLAPYLHGRTRRGHYEASAEPWYPLRAAAASRSASPGLAPSASLLTVEGPAWVTAARLGSDGRSTLLRALRTDEQSAAVTLRPGALGVSTVEHTDAVENSLGSAAPLPASGALALDGALTTVRLR